MTLLAKLKLRLPRASTASSSSTTSSGSASTASASTSTTSSQRPSLAARDSPIDQMKAEVVLVVGAENGLLVPATKHKSAGGKRPLTSSSASSAASTTGDLESIDTADITAAFKPASKAWSKTIDIASVPAVNQSVFLLSLPSELLVAISMHAGFFASLRLMNTCRRFSNLLNDPSAWLTYTRGGSSDMIQTEVQICTKIHTFDHLVFGMWHGGGVTSPVVMDKDGGTNNIRCEPNIYFEHITFNEQFDYLGGVSLSMAPSGLVNSEFFDHRETLPCYKDALNAAVAAGILPPSAPHGGPPSGSKIDHSCTRCARYDDREVLKSLFVFDQVPHHPRWGREGFGWDYDYPDGRRRLRITIKPFQGALGYTSVRDLPSVFVNCLTVNGRQLKGTEYETFMRLVNGHGVDIKM